MIRSSVFALAGLALTAAPPLLNSLSSTPEPRKLLEGRQSLTTTAWKSQLGVQHEPSSVDQWVYLSGTANCPNRTLCRDFDVAVTELHEAQQKRARGVESFPAQPNLNFVDCDAEPVLCHSWLLVPPAFMHMSGSATGSHVVLRPIQLPLKHAATYPSLAAGDADMARQQIAFLLDDSSSLSAAPVQERFDEWQGFLNPFIGTLGKQGGGTYWGQVKHTFGWLPVSQPTVVAGALLLVRLLLRRIGPKQTETTAADMVVPPGSIN
jgi:hypothetical protein